MRDLSDAKIPKVDEVGDRAAEIAKNAQDLAGKVWDETGVQDAASDVASRAKDAADEAWDAAKPVVDDAAAGAARGAKDAAYVAGRAGLGAAKVGENAVKTVKIVGSELTGDKEGAVEAATTNDIDMAAENLGSALDVNDSVRELGDGAEVAGNVIAGFGLSYLAPPIGNALFALDAAGAVLETEAQDGELEAIDYAYAAGVGAVAGIAPVAVEKAVKAATPATEKVAGDASEVAETMGAKSLTQIEKVRAEAISRIKGTPIESFSCRNTDLAGLPHPETGVTFRERYIVQPSGRIVEGVFPKFESGFDAKIPEKMYEASNKEQFKIANSQLLESIEKNGEMAKKFSAEQIEQIRDGVIDGTAPDGFVWHHSEDEGVLQLVDRAVHEATGHTGGRTIWGGGYA